jgi:hypothetical protein
MSRGRVLTVYDGRDRRGRIEIAKDGEARAFNRRGKLLGHFATLKTALHAFDASRAEGIAPEKAAGVDVPVAASAP